MDKRPYSDEDIEQLKSAVYVPPEPLHPIFIILLTIAWPLGLFYFFHKHLKKTSNAAYLLNQCKTEQEREALFSYLRLPPKVYQHNVYKTHREQFNRYRNTPGTFAYQLTHPKHR